MRLRWLTTMLVAAVPVLAQYKPPDGSQIADCLLRVERHNLGVGISDENSYIEPLARAHVIQAIPDLETLFAGSKDEEERTELASALVRLGDKDESYWEVLITYAAPAVTMDLPLPFDFSVANATSDKPSAAFLAAAKAHQLSVEAARQLAMFELPLRLTYMAKTGDARAIPLLRGALHSPDLMIRQTAATGLSECGDKASIPVLIAMCRKASPMEARMLAYSLLFFDDPAADEAAKHFYLADGQNLVDVKKFVGPHAFVF